MNGTPRRRFLALASAAALATPGISRAQTGSQPQARLIVPFAPGGTTDTLARLITPKMTERLGQTWVVENRSGASGVIGGEFVARSAPDGQVLLISPKVHLMARHVLKSVSYEPFADFTPVARLAEEPYVLIANARTVAPDDVRSLAGAMKQDPAKYAFAYPSLGSVSHLVAALFGRQLGITPLTIAYRGTGPAMNDLMAGTVGLMVAPMAPAIELIRSRQVKALAVATAERLPILPDVPTLAETGFPNLDIVDWLGIWGPKGLPTASRDRLAAAIRAAIEDPGVLRRMQELGLRPVRETPPEFDALVARERTNNERIVAEAGIVPE
ncbi:Bug family tripartite tricarboxylate transporter substrate binding protein [Roseomonas populi]|uniref:Tripartite tricarboxylate transporter substrate binding protein n=1 Tax=Roseomonas populi TaxID=3121582 RepID=A0ABT1X289_9PROT|nr:tripartite tricarboxylate transporter substrate binding protein [Roseomonas pecuniae]MCR0981901.1 tripartite tricarboxylate transporter substrate binding protein [Roseomonas pecuniae]